jgi:hypothetical protein
MMSERALVSAIFQTALAGGDANVNARRNAIWLAAITLLSDVLLSADEFTRERLLQRLVPELRASMVDLSCKLLPGRQLN